MRNPTADEIRRSQILTDSYGRTDVRDGQLLIEVPDRSTGQTRTLPVAATDEEWEKYYRYVAEDDDCPLQIITAHVLEAIWEASLHPSARRCVLGPLGVLLVY